MVKLLLSYLLIEQLLGIVTSDIDISSAKPSIIQRGETEWS